MVHMKISSEDRKVHHLLRHLGYCSGAKSGQVFDFFRTRLKLPVRLENSFDSTSWGPGTGRVVVGFLLASSVYYLVRIFAATNILAATNSTNLFNHVFLENNQ